MYPMDFKISHTKIDIFWVGAALICIYCMSFFSLNSIIVIMVSHGNWFQMYMRTFWAKNISILSIRGDCGVSFLSFVALFFWPRDCFTIYVLNRANVQERACFFMPSCLKCSCAHSYQKISCSMYKCVLWTSKYLSQKSIFSGVGPFWLVSTVCLPCVRSLLSVQNQSLSCTAGCVSGYRRFQYCCLGL